MIYVSLKKQMMTLHIFLATDVAVEKGSWKRPEETNWSCDDNE